MDIKLAAKATRPFLEECINTMPGPILAGGNATSVEHLSDMLDKIESGEVAGEKAHRWLGWVQGVVCCRGGATLEEMKAVNLAA